MFVKSKSVDFYGLNETIIEKIEELKTYIPHYELILPPKEENGIIIMSVRVKGVGDYLPPYAGNLDIINCAAIKITQKLVN
jgi:acetaldehyde dehydrogenase